MFLLGINEKMQKNITNGSNGQIFAVTFFAKKRKKAAIKLRPQMAALYVKNEGNHAQSRSSKLDQ
jgi:hypothetical protein